MNGGWAPSRAGSAKREGGLPHLPLVAVVDVDDALGPSLSLTFGAVGLIKLFSQGGAVRDPPGGLNDG